MEQSAETGEKSAQVDLDSLDITNLIDRKAVQNLSRTLSKLRGDSTETPVPFKIPSHGDFLIPVIAKAIIPGRDSQPQVLSFDQIKEFQPFVADISWIISRFSKRLAARFDRFVERKGTQALSIALARIIDLTEAFNEIENPRQQFLNELKKLYQDLPQFKDSAQGPFTVLARALDNLHKSSKKHWFKEKYPLIGNMWSILPVQVYSTGMRMDIAAPEIHRGIAAFLSNHGIDADYGALSIYKPLRVPATIFAKQSLTNAQEQVPQVLEAVYQVLPENGQEFRQKIEGFAKNIVSSKKRGISDREIFHAVFKTINSQV